jgi:hypothetical protein
MISSRLAGRTNANGSPEEYSPISINLDPAMGTTERPRDKSGVVPNSRVHHGISVNEFSVLSEDQRNNFSPAKQFSLGHLGGPHSGLRHRDTSPAFSQASVGRAKQRHGDENIKVYVRMRPLNATEHADAGAKSGHGGAHWALGLAGNSH